MRPRTGQQLSNGRLHPAVIRSNNRASHPPSWYLLQCEASQLEAEMSHEENENNTDIDPIEVTIAAGATLSSPARASISRKRPLTKPGSDRIGPDRIGSDRTDKTWIGSDRTHKTWIRWNSIKQIHIYSLKVGAFQIPIKKWSSGISGSR